MKKPVIIFGAHEMGRVALDILQQNDVVVYGFLDDDEALQGQEINHVPVLGNTTAESYWELLGKDCEAFIALANQKKQATLLAMLKEKKQLVPINAIHISAIVEESAMFGHGNLMNANVVLGTNATLGNSCTLHTQVAVEHGAVIKDFVQVGAGSVIGPNVTLHEEVFVGAGATIVAGVEIGAEASIGAGAVVLENVKPGEAVLGNPAKPVQLK
ncbi:MAG: NeuD/PglB/VioB family sugar acetyltransferase [Bacteroidota bacterium]